MLSPAVFPFIIIIVHLADLEALRPRGYWRVGGHGKSLVSADGDEIHFLSKLLHHDARSDVLVISSPPSPHSGAFDQSLVQLCALFQPDCLLGSFEPESDNRATSSIATLPSYPSISGIFRGLASVIKGWVAGVAYLVMRWVRGGLPSPSFLLHSNNRIPDVAKALQPIGEKVVAADLEHSSKVSLVASMMDKLSFPSFKSELQSYLGEDTPLGGDIIDISSEDIADVIVNSLSSGRLTEGTVLSLKKVSPEVLVSLQRARAKHMIDFITLDLSHQRVIIFLEQTLKEPMVVELSENGFTGLEAMDCDALRHLCAESRPHSETDPTTRLFRSFEQPISYALDWVGAVQHDRN